MVWQDISIKNSMKIKLVFLSPKKCGFFSIYRGLFFVFKTPKHTNLETNTIQEEINVSNNPKLAGEKTRGLFVSSENGRLASPKGDSNLSSLDPLSQ